MNEGQERRRWTVQIVRCGGCGKPRGVRHTCVRRLGRRPQRTRVKPQVRVRCGTCGQRRTPFGVHTCATDFNARKRRHATARRRAREAAARRQRREREAAGRRARRERETEARRRRRDREAAARQERRRRQREREQERRKRAAETRSNTPRNQRGRKPHTRPNRRAPNPNEHRFDMCRDDECQRRPCVAYRQGVEDCPLPHGV